MVTHEQMQTVTRYLVSSGQTFLAGFLISVVPVLSTLTVEDFGSEVLKGTIMGIVAVGVRGGLKYLYEMAMNRLDSKA